jgi:hypothetical protein
MTKRSMTRTASRSSHARWAIVGLVLFLVVDAVLVGWALVGDRFVGPGSATRTPASAQADPEPTATPTAGPAAAPERVLSVLDEETAWRSTVGACPGTAPTLERTTDGGSTWQSSDIAGIADVAGVAAIQLTSEDQASVVALAAEGCAPVLALTYVGGDDWVAYPDRAAGTWFVDPGTPSRVHSPSGDRTAPCSTVVSLAPRDARNAAVLCADHTVHRTIDAGATWSEPVAVAGSVAIAGADDGYLLATTGSGTTGSADCAGVTVTTLPDGGTAPDAEAACAVPSAPEPGQVALATGGGSAWLWAGDSIVTSEDGGKTWR